MKQFAIKNNTPPVCGGVFIAATMVGENWFKVALSAMALGLGLYIVPLAMVRHQSLIELDKQPLESIITALQLGVGLLLLGKGLIGIKWSITRLTLISIAIVIMFGFNVSNYF